MFLQLEQRSSLPRSRCRPVTFALHQNWGAEMEGRQLKVLPRSQENRHTVLKCRNILLSNMKIFSFWQVQNVLSLKTSPCLTLTSRTDCPLGKLIENSREYLHLGQPSYCPAHIRQSAMRTHQWKLPFPTRAIWTLSKPLRFMLPEALFRPWCREIPQRKSWNTHKGNATAWPSKAVKE